MNKKQIAVLVVCAFFILLTEGFARYSIHNDWILTTTPLASSTRWRMLWTRAYSRGGLYYDKMDTHHPLLGWSPRKNARNVPNGDAVANFNADGIRGTKTYKKEKPPETIRVAVIGDSFSFGEGVGDEETYAAQLEKNIPKSEVINFGVHGYGIDQMSLRLTVDGFRYNPDIVIYAFIDDDLGRVDLDFRDYIKPKYRLSDGKLILTNTPIPSPEEFMKRSRFRPAIIDALPLLRDRIVFRDNQYTYAEPLIRAIWKQTVTEIREHDALPIFLFLPTGKEMITEDHTPYAEQLMDSFCRDEHITCFSARPYLIQAYKEGARYDLNTHYEPATHAIIGTGLTRDLMNIFEATGTAETVSHSTNPIIDKL